MNCCKNWIDKDRPVSAAGVAEGGSDFVGKNIIKKHLIASDRIL